MLLFCPTDFRKNSNLSIRLTSATVHGVVFDFQIGRVTKVVRSGIVRNQRVQDDEWWAHKGSNLGPLPCEGVACR